jgi:hypothetical protein
MELKFLKAGTGDSILVQHNNHNILIDGGNDSKYLLAEIDKIYEKGEAIDLLIITHHDDDHIRGIIDLLNHINENDYSKESKFINKVIFNSPRRVLEKLPSGENLLSYKQAYEVEELLTKTKAEWTTYTDNSGSLHFDDLEIVFLSPLKADLEKYSLQKGAYLSGDFKCDWKSPMTKLDKYIDDKSLDKSISNKSSVVLKLQSDNKNVLLTGDVTPDRLECIINKLSIENGENPIHFDIIKLPHHGSYRSVTKNILEKIKCNTFIISTNSKKHFLPNKRAILKILKLTDRTDRQPIKFMFNYEEALNNLEITNKDKKDYNFILTPNNEKYGISI